MDKKAMPTVTKFKFTTSKELAELYEISPRTFTRWVKRHEATIGERHGRFYTAAQVRLIFDVLGKPSKLDLES